MILQVKYELKVKSFFEHDSIFLWLIKGGKIYFAVWSNTHLSTVHTFGPFALHNKSKIVH